MRFKLTEAQDPYSPFNKGKYLVVGAETIGREDVGQFQSHSTDSPEEAIKYWFEFEKNTPSETSIETQTKANADELIDWAYNNLDKVEQFYNEIAKGKCAYTLESYIKGIQDKHEKGQLGFYEGVMGDSIYPFCCG